MSPLWPLAHIQGRPSGTTSIRKMRPTITPSLHAIVAVAPLGRPISSALRRTRNRAAYPTANELWPKPLDLRLERGFDRPVRRLNGDHARPGIGDTASLADALDLRPLLREF